MPDLNKDTGVPHKLSLGDVLNDIELAPAQITALLHSFAFPHVGGPNDELGRTLMQHGNIVSDPATYNSDAPGADNPQARWGQAQTAQQGQSAIPSMGTTNEPAWVADARAAGWTPQDANKPQPATTFGSPPPATVGSDRARHFDNERGVWVFNDTGERVDLPGNPPPPSAPPSTSPAPAFAPPPGNPPV